MELSILCDCDISLLIFSAQGKLIQYCSDPHPELFFAQARDPGTEVLERHSNITVRNTVRTLFRLRLLNFSFKGMRFHELKVPRCVIEYVLCRALKGTFLAALCHFSHSPYLSLCVTLQLFRHYFQPQEGPKSQSQVERDTIEVTSFPLCHSVVSYPLAATFSMCAHAIVLYTRQ